MANRKRSNSISFRVSGEEKEMIDFKLKLSNLPKGVFYRKMVIDGQVMRNDIEWEKEKFEKMHKLTNEINKIGVNVNQIAKHCNQNESISYNDYISLQEKLDKIWQLIKTRLYKV